MQPDLQLKRGFTFWFSATEEGQTEKSSQNYKDLVKPLGSFSSARGFWSFYQHMERPEKLLEGQQILLFAENIQPVWEDKQNARGGRFILRVRRAYANRIWEELALQFVGDETGESSNVCGIIMHVKKNFILFSIWIKEVNTADHEVIENWIIKLLGLNKNTVEFLAHPREGNH